MTARVQRTRTVEWRVHWVDSGQDRVCYIGRWQVGRVVRRVAHRRVTYVAHFSVPGIHGPVATEQDQQVAAMKLMAKVKEWLGGLRDDPPSIEDEKERARPRRVRAAK